jgi:hypothetical protein
MKLFSLIIKSLFVGLFLSSSAFAVQSFSLKCTDIEILNAADKKIGSPSGFSNFKSDAAGSAVFFDFKKNKYILKYAESGRMENFNTTVFMDKSSPDKSENLISIMERSQDKKIIIIHTLRKGGGVVEKNMYFKCAAD